MDSPGRPPVTIDLSNPGSETTLKDKPFKIKEGAKFTMSATFKVQHEILSGLHYVQIVKRKGIKVSKDSEMIVCSFFLLAPARTPRALSKEIRVTDMVFRVPMPPTQTSSLFTPRSVRKKDTQPPPPPIQKTLKAWKY